jgi:uncharacterized iron-regulated protein
MAKRAEKKVEASEVSEEIKVKAPKLLNSAEMKKLAKASNKRMGKDFMSAWNNFTRKKLADCIAYHNAGKKTLDAGTVAYICGK